MNEPSTNRAVGPPIIVDYNPEWPSRFEEEAARIRDALGDVALRIEHVGSTAVPGLAAKDTIDIQISVPRMDRSLYEGPLESLGYTSVWDMATGEHHFFGRPYETRPRLFNVHVCPVGSEWERRHLAFRDHLRADPEAARRYEAFKREIAPNFDDTLEYAHAKEGFIREMEYEAGLMDPTALAVIDQLKTSIVEVTGSSLVGLYVFGSLVEGDFDTDVSDIDLIAVLAGPPSEPLATRLRLMHDDFARANHEWDDRIEVVYVSKGGLAHCRTETTSIGIISPGEPFHVVQVGRGWILNWYPARANSLTLIGQPIATLIPPIPAEEYIHELRLYLADFENRVDDDSSSGAQAYAILSLCRGLHSIRKGYRLSKRQAASWARHEFPKWADLIEQAVGWRDRQSDAQAEDGRATIHRTGAFIEDMTKLALNDQQRRQAGT